MTTPFQDPEQPLTLAQVEAWIRAATVKRLQLDFHAMDPNRAVRELASQGMRELCAAAIEEVRVVSAQLCEDSQAARLRSADMVAEAARLLAQLTPRTESQLLQIFTGQNRQDETR